jgi:hypothetical protein
VYDTSATLKDGNYVRLLAGDGTIWLYDHLSDNTIVKAGQVLAQPQEPGDDDMNRKATRDEVITIYQQALGIEPTEEQIAAQCAANTPLEVMHSIAGDVNAKRDGDKHNLDQNIAAVADLSGKLHNVATVLGVPDDETAIIDEIIKLKKG